MANNSEKKRVLVSGGAGYIGSHVTVELIEAGYDVVVADNMSNCDMTCFEGVKKITGRDDIPFVKIDCCDADSVNKLFSDYRIDAVIHFAAFKAVGESVAEPIKYYRNNLDSFLNILEASKTHGGCNVLFSSSATVYGEAEKLPVTEESPRLPATSPYGNTKQICEDILRDVVSATASLSGTEGPVKGIALRYFNPIGAHPSALIGELPRGVPNNLVPFITQTAIGKRECLSIFGNDYPTEDGTCLRDYIDIVDLAKAHVAAVSRMLDGKMKKDYEIFNIGTGRPVSVYELVTKFEKVNGLKLNYKFAPRRPGDVVAIWADTALANEELGWKAERSVEETLASAWAWEKHLAEK
ncbi:MAG: UDP-glucose 4-epimerase GalE [Bacteroidales bacterium]|nr:UDP-glucose 4-epimerase GalE [Bacteroidales bacterium]